MNPQAIIAKLKQYPIAVGGFVFILIVGGGYFLRKSHVPELEGKREILEVKWEAMTANATESIDIAEHVEKINDYSKEIKTRLMVRESKAINQQYFYGLQEQTGISLTTLAQSDIPPPPRAPPGKPNLTLYAPIAYSVGISGTFYQVLDFLNRLEHGRYFTRIEGFSCNTLGGNETDAVQISLKMDILGVK